LPGTEHASLEVAANAEPYVLAISTAIGFTAVCKGQPVSMLADALITNRYLRSYGTRLRPFSHEADSPSEFLQINRRSLSFNRVQLPTRVSALFATSLQCVHLARGFPSPRYVPSSGDHNLSTVCSALQLVSLFHPTAAFRTLPVQGFCRSAQPPSLIGRSCPLVVEARLAHRRIGCHEPSTSTSRLFSAQSRESQGRRLDLAHDRSPLRVCCSSRYPPDRCPRFPEDKRS
jgi:hypothetical protein